MELVALPEFLVPEEDYRHHGTYSQQTEEQKVWSPALLTSSSSSSLSTAFGHTNAMSFPQSIQFKFDGINPVSSNRTKPSSPRKRNNVCDFCRGSKIKCNMYEDGTCENCRQRCQPCTGPVPTEKAKARRRHKAVYHSNGSNTTTSSIRKAKDFRRPTLALNTSKEELSKAKAQFEGQSAVSSSDSSSSSSFYFTAPYYPQMNDYTGRAMYSNGILDSNLEFPPF